MAKPSDVLKFISSSFKSGVEGVTEQAVSTRDKARGAFQQFFKPTADVRARDVVREAASMFSEVPDDPKEAAKRGFLPIPDPKTGKTLFAIEPSIGGLSIVGKKGVGIAAKGVKKAGTSLIDNVKTMFKSPAITKHLEFLTDISAPQKFRPPIKGAKVGALGTAAKGAIKEGIALRSTKGGKIVPNVRVSGIFVPDDFTKYKNFKDVQPGTLGGTKDITRLIQEIDGALPVEELVKLADQTGPLSKNVLFRTRDIMRTSIEWSGEMAARFKNTVGNIKPKSKDSFLANRVLEKIDSAGKNLSVEDLMKKPEIRNITNNSETVRFARDARGFFDDLLDMQNVVRKTRNQELIPKRNLYSPNEFKNRTLWERSFGLNKQPQDLIRSPELPDYIFPDKPFNPRELARQSRMPELMREMDLVTLIDNYIGTANKDIFATSIVQNNKAFINQLDTMGYPNSARALQNWTAEAFGGIKSQLDRAVNLSPNINKGMRWFRNRLVKSVFPLNFAWNTTVQTSSINLTGAKYGWINTGKSALEWATNPKVRGDIAENAYSAIVKSQKTGKISKQSINEGVQAAKRIQQSKLDTAADAANFLTESIERHLTGISVRAGFNDGTKRGLKGKALWEYASDAGGKTQSMYNMEDLPGVLRSNIAKTTAPFQTFSFEMFNTMREWAGKTGMPPGTSTERIKQVLRFIAGMIAINQIGSKATGREPWEASSFIPYYGTFIAPILSDNVSETTRGLPATVGIARDVYTGIKNAVTKGDWKKLRQVSIKFGLPFGGTQVSKTVDGIISIAKQGQEDSSGKLLFPIVKTKEQVRALLLGPYKTEAGRKYIEERFGK